MLSPQLRQKVQTLWDLFWSSGISNPLSAIEQITYLLFIRQLENLDRERVAKGKRTIYYSTRVGPEMEVRINGELGLSSGSHNRPDLFGVDYSRCRWSYIKQNPSFDLLNGIVFPWLRGLEEWLSKNSLSTAFTASSFKNLPSFVEALANYDMPLL